MISIETLKEQLNLGDTNDDDSILTIYLNAAKLAASNYIDRPILWDSTSEIETGDLTSIHATAEIELAVLMMSAHWYENRETVVIGTITAEVPFSFKFILNPFRILY